ncbi:MAG: Lactose transport system permease protein LacF [Turneriella sp.]|nr:Lactose transport system permease protein LacF [Turneriella sp.]
MKKFTPYLWLMPFLLVFGIFLAYPMAYSFIISLKKVTWQTNLYEVFSDMQWVGFDNYRELLHRADFWWSLIATFLYMLLTIPLGIFLSLLLATLLSENLFGAKFFRSALFLPNILDMLVIGLVWKLIYSPDGLLDTAFMKMGVHYFHAKGFLGDAHTALAAVAVAMVLKSCGFGMVLFLTALKNISPNIFEAADLDGMTWWQKFYYIRVPLVKPVILFLVVTGILGSLNAFTEFYIMTEGNPVTLFAGETVGATRVSGYLLFNRFTEMNYGSAAAMSYFLLIFALVVSFINYRLLREKA